MTRNSQGEEVKRVELEDGAWWDIVIAPSWGRLTDYQRQVMDLAQQSGSALISAQDVMMLSFTVGWSHDMPRDVESLQSLSALEVVTVAQELDGYLSPLFDGAMRTMLRRFTSGSRVPTGPSSPADTET